VHAGIVTGALCAAKRNRQGNGCTLRANLRRPLIHQPICGDATAVNNCRKTAENIGLFTIERLEPGE
jgi:hypothetical protein